MITGRDAQRGHALRAVMQDRFKAQDEVRRLELVEECIRRIGRHERPFRHDYTDFSHHNGDPYRTHDTVWAVDKPTARTEDETYTLMDMPEYDEAARRIHEAVSTPIEEKDDGF